MFDSDYESICSEDKLPTWTSSKEKRARKLCNQADKAKTKEDWVEAEHRYLKALSIWRNILHEYHDKIESTLFRLSLVQHKLNKYQESGFHMFEMFRIYREGQWFDDPRDEVEAFAKIMEASGHMDLAKLKRLEGLPDNVPCSSLAVKYFVGTIQDNY
jgi:hypothetical protein